jgi:hypothetical protein
MKIAYRKNPEFLQIKDLGICTYFLLEIKPLFLYCIVPTAKPHHIQRLIRQKPKRQIRDIIMGNTAKRLWQRLRWLFAHVTDVAKLYM